MVDIEKNTVLRDQDLKEEPYVILQNLTKAEETLMKEKKKLETKITKMRLTIKNEIQNKMSNIQNLR